MPVTNSVIQNMKNTYESRDTTLGISSESSIRSGLNYASALWNTENLIKAERLVEKLAAVSQIASMDQTTTFQLMRISCSNSSRNVMLVYYLITKNSKLCDTKMMGQSALSKAQL